MADSAPAHWGRPEGTLQSSPSGFIAGNRVIPRSKAQQGRKPIAVRRKPTGSGDKKKPSPEGTKDDRRPSNTVIKRGDLDVVLIRPALLLLGSDSGRYR